MVSPVGAAGLLAVLAAGCDMQDVNHKQMLESLGKHSRQAQLRGGRLNFTSKPLSSPSMHVAVCTRACRSLGQLGDVTPLSVMGHPPLFSSTPSICLQAAPSGAETPRFSPCTQL